MKSPPPPSKVLAEGDAEFEVHSAVTMESSNLLGYKEELSGESQPTFRRYISPPSSGSGNKPIKKAERRGQKALCSSETSVDYDLTTRGYILECRMFNMLQVSL
jgi:hypothetical protein